MLYKHLVVQALGALNCNCFDLHWLGCHSNFRFLHLQRNWFLWWFTLTVITWFLKFILNEYALHSYGFGEKCNWLFWFAYHQSFYNAHPCSCHIEVGDNLLQLLCYSRLSLIWEVLNKRCMPYPFCLVMLRIEWTHGERELSCTVKDS
jgi:hypothetical protein